MNTRTGTLPTNTRTFVTSITSEPMTREPRLTNRTAPGTSIARWFTSILTIRSCTTAIATFE